MCQIKGRHFPVTCILITRASDLMSAQSCAKEESSGVEIESRATEI